MQNHTLIQTVAPTAAPDHVGQNYYNSSTDIWYKAKGVSSVDDWDEQAAGGGGGSSVPIDMGALTDGDYGKVLTPAHHGQTIYNPDSPKTLFFDLAALPVGFTVMVVCKNAGGTITLRYGVGASNTDFATVTAGTARLCVTNVQTYELAAVNSVALT